MELAHSINQTFQAIRVFVFFAETSISGLNLNLNQWCRHAWLRQRYLTSTTAKQPPQRNCEGLSIPISNRVPFKIILKDSTFLKDA